MKKILFSAFAVFISLTSGYAQNGGCTPTGDCTGVNNHIDAVTIGEIRHANNVCTSGGYFDYSATKFFYVIPGEVHTAFVDWSRYADHIAVIWIDWNNDNDFTGDDEMFRAPLSDPNYGGTAAIQVPAGQVIGDTIIMRVGVFANMGSGTEDPCLGSTLALFREAEDYSVIITDEINVEPTYCEAKGTDFCGTLTTNATDPTAPPDTSDTYIVNVRLIGDNGTEINNTSTRPDCRAGQGYSDYSNISAEVSNTGGSYVLEVTRAVNYVWGQAAVWVDWNDNKIFEPTEEVETGAPAASVHTMTITPPPGITTGYKRMRIRTRLGPGATFSPCGEQTGGEVEDYTLLYIDAISPTPDCVTLNSPVDGDSDHCTGNVTFKWSAASGGEAATGYKFYLGTNNPPTSLENGNDMGLATSYSLPYDLPSNQTYYWSVIAYNDNGDALDCDIWEFTTATNADPSIDQILLGGVDVDSAAVCADVDLAILANISGGTGTVNFAWTGDDVYLDDNSVNDPIFNSLDAFGDPLTLRLTVIDANQCTARDSIKVYVKEAPVVGTLSADKAAVCANETVTLTLAGYNATITDWEKAEGANPYASVNHIQDVLATTINVDTQFKVLLTNGEGCEGESNQVTVTHKAAPSAPTIAIDPSNTACEGDTITLTATPGTNIVWNDTNNSTTGSIAVTTGGTYNVTYTDATSGCSATSSNEVITFNALPANPTITITGTTCEGDTVILSTQYNSDLVWEVDGISFPAITVSAEFDETYTVTYTDATTNCSSSSTESVVFSPRPTAPIIEQSGDSLITNPTQIVNWLDADGNVVATGESFSPDRTPGQTFTAVVVDGNNCESFESNEIAYDHTVGIAMYHQAAFMVYPNPATSELNIQVESSIAAGMYQIKDMAGRTVIAVELVSGINTISLAEIQSGIYMLQNNAGNTIRIVKQ